MGRHSSATREAKQPAYFGTRMKHEFIELTGKTLLEVVNEGEIDLKQLHQAGVKGDSILRINRHGEIELRRKSSWVLVGGLIGNFEERLRSLTGLEWAG
jgi:phage protein U